MIQDVTQALAPYDKQQRQVNSSGVPSTATPEPVPNGAKHPSSGMADALLQPGAITRLQDQIKDLAPARLHAFSKGFRSAFQVPEAQPSLAGLITTSRHQRWIEGFLANAATS